MDIVGKSKEDVSLPKCEFFALMDDPPVFDCRRELIECFFLDCLTFKLGRMFPALRLVKYYNMFLDLDRMTWRKKGA